MQTPQETKPIPLSTSVLLSREDGPRCGRSIILQGCFSQVGQPRTPLESKTNSRRYETYPPRTCPGWPAKGNQGSAPVGGRNCLDGQLEARRPLAASSLPSSTRAGTYLCSEHLAPSLKSLFKAQGLKTRKVPNSVDLWPSHMAPSGAGLSPLGELSLNTSILYTSYHLLYCQGRVLPKLLGRLG